MKKLLHVLLLILVFTMTGCANEKENHTEPVKEVMELVIFYEDGTENILADFKLQYPEYKVLMKKANSEEDVERLKLYHGEPDIILLNYAMNPDDDRSLELKYGQDLTELVREDTSIENGKYFPGTFLVCQNGKELSALPLGVSLEMMMLNEDEWNESSFNMLEEGYTAKELFEAFEHEMEREEEIGFYIDSDLVGISYKRLQLCGAITEKDGVFLVDEALYAQLYNIWYNGKQKRDASGEEGVYGKGIGYGSLGAPQTVITYTTSQNQYLYGKDTHVIYVPTVEDGSSYGASVQIVGMVGKNSARTEQAYKALRIMMDMPVKTFSAPGDIFQKTFCPVNCENAYGMLESFEKSLESEGNEAIGTLTINAGLGEKYTVNCVKMGEREREKLKHVLENITFLYRVTDEGRAADEILEFYKEENIKSYQESYQVIVNLLNEPQT